MKKALAFATVLLAISAAPTLAVDVCNTYSLTASSAWVFLETDVRVTVMEPGAGNNEGDCMTNPWSCATYRCETTEESEIQCKATPGGQCLDLTIERCISFPEGTKFLPIIRTITLHGSTSGPCE